MPKLNGADCPITKVEVSAYTVPTDLPEADGTLAWNSTTLILAHIHAAGECGLGYTYADLAAADTIRDHLAPAIIGCPATDIPRAWKSMETKIRNLGRTGVDTMAVSAVDIALWDLKAKIFGTPLAVLLGPVRDGIAAYGSGGFTSYTDRQLADQLAGWAEQGLTRFKMKVGSQPCRDPERVQIARETVGPQAELFVDANGAYDRKQALALAEAFHRQSVSWFEEPVVARDLEGLRLLRDRAPAGMDIAAGEYGYGLPYFRRMIAAGAVDVLQADATRCGGITGFLAASVLAEASEIPFSSHCAPTVHVHPGCAALPMRHVEYFHDHVRIENMLFDGVPEPRGGVLYPDLSRPGLGLEFKQSDALRYAR